MPAKSDPSPPTAAATLSSSQQPESLPAGEDASGRDQPVKSAAPTAPFHSAPSGDGLPSRSQRLLRSTSYQTLSDDDADADQGEAWEEAVSVWTEPDGLQNLRAPTAAWKGTDAEFGMSAAWELVDLFRQYNAHCLTLESPEGVWRITIEKLPDDQRLDAGSREKRRRLARKAASDARNRV